MDLKNLADLSLFTLTRCIACDRDYPTTETFPICASCEDTLLPGFNLAEKGPPEMEEWIQSEYHLFQMTEAAYPVLRRWKTRRGPLFDHRVLKRVDRARLKEHLEQGAIEAIVPIPQHYRRSWKMGGSPALKLARFVSRIGGIGLNTKILSSAPNRSGQRQAELTGWQRQQTRLRFKPAENRKGIRNVLIVDDFSTTGHTLNEAARALKEAGYGKIHTLCLGAGRRSSFDLFGREKNGVN